MFFERHYEELKETIGRAKHAKIALFNDYLSSLKETIGRALHFNKYKKLPKIAFLTTFLRKHGKKHQKRQN